MTAHLSWSQLDPALITWGVAYPADNSGGGHSTFTVRAHKSCAEAQIEAGLVGRIPVHGMGLPVEPLVYHAPHGWIFSATGQHCRTQPNA